jgi:hypothetical protein
MILISLHILPTKVVGGVSAIVFSSCFHFDLFLSGAVLSFRGTVASANNDKEKMPSEDDHLNPKLKKEVESEATEEIEEDQRPCPRIIVASIGVVTNPNKFKKGGRISTGGSVPRHFLAPRTSSSGNNPFHTLIHEYQFQRVPKAKLPSSWDIDCSNSAEKESFKCEEEWGNNSKSWDSQSDRFMNRIEHNTELIHNLTDKIDELKELIAKLIKDSPPPPKE